MIKRLLLAVICSMSLTSLFAQLSVYDSRTLPLHLIKGANSVKRLEEIEFFIKDAANGSYKCRQVITVLDASGKDELHFQEYSDKLRSLSEAEIKVYDANGIVLNKYKKREMETVMQNDESIDDVKITYFTVSAASYPITVEFIYQIDFSGFFQYPGYVIQTPGQSVERSTFSLQVPADQDIRYKAMNVAMTPVVKEDLKSKTKNYHWTALNLKAKNREAGAGSIKRYFPWIMIAPNKVDYQGYAGNMATWKDMGLWYNDLVKDMLEVPPAVKQVVEEIVKDARTDEEKARLIYNYLQKNFRYVSVQLGIGGFKPYPASYVHSKKYGDCKALSNYMYACLKAANIKSYNAWITSDVYPPQIDPDFPYDPFNHQVICIPNGKDTIWLECTSSTSDFGVLGSSTENRYALLLKEDGGVLVRTPVSKASSNSFSTKTKIDLLEDASGKVSSELTGKGEFKDELYYVSRYDADKQKYYFLRYLEFPQADQHIAKFEEAKDEKLTATLELDVEKIPAFTAGSKMFLNPRTYTICHQNLPQDSSRSNDYFLDHPYEKMDSTIYQLPADFVVESLPKPRDIKFEYGNFKTSYAFDKEQRTVITTAKLVFNTQKIPAAKYEATRKFFVDVHQEYTDKIVIKKN